MLVRILKRGACIVPACVNGSWRVLDEAIGRMRRVVAHAVGRAGSLVDRWCIPPPSREFPSGSGCTNPLDVLVGVLGECERPELVLEWVCGQFKGHFVTEPAGYDGLCGWEFVDMKPRVKELAGLIGKGHRSVDEERRLRVLALEVGAWLVMVGRQNGG